MQKRCSKCKCVKPLSDFSRNKSKSDGYAGCCKVCARESNKAWRKKNPHWQTRRTQAWRKKNPGKLKQKLRRYYFRKKYGMTVEQRDALFASQNGTCANPACSGAAEHIDHSHESGKVRGMLCFRCNTALGSLGENIPRIHGLITYLEQYESRN